MGFTQLTVIMYIGVLAVFVAVATALPLEDTPEVVEAKAKFTAAFAAAEKGEHAALAPVNNDVQAAAPVFTGDQIPTTYLADTMEVADAKATFKAAFDDAAAGGLAAKQVPSPEVPAVAAVKLAAPVPVATPVVYAAPHPYTYHTGLTALTHPVVPYTTLTHNVLPHTALTYTHGYPYAGYVPFPVVTAAKPAEAPVVEAE